MNGVLSLLTTAISLVQLLIIVRIVLSYFPGAAYHPIGRVICAVVDPILAPFRRLLPTFGGMDFSPMLAILVLYGVSQVLNRLQYGGVLDISSSIRFVITELILGIFVIFLILLLIRVVMSLLHASPFHPLVLFIRQVTNPLVRPFSGLTPRSRGFDVDGLIALAVYFAIYLAIRILVVHLLY